MKDGIHKILSPRVFALFYLPWLAINMTSVVNVLDFTRLVLIVYAAWAVAVAVKMYLFSGKAPWVEKAQPVLLVFLAACLLSQVLQFSAGGFDALGKLCYFSLCLLVLYPQHGTTLADYKATFSVVARVLGIVIGVMMAVCAWMFVNLYQSTILIRNGREVYLGFAENRLYGIFTSPNVGSTYALILLWCSVLVLAWSGTMRHKVLWRVLAAVQIFLGVMYISVALSRGGYVSGLVMAGSFLLLRAPLLRSPFDRLWKRVAPNGLGNLVKALLVGAGVALGLLVCVFGVQLTNKLSVSVMVWNHERLVASGQLQQSEEDQAIIDNALLGADGRVEANREDIDITNKRMSIWTTHLAMLKGKHLFIGVNQPLMHLAAHPEAEAALTDAQLAEANRAGGNMHNGFLQILVNCGALALLPMLLFLGWCVVLAVRMLLRQLKTRATIDRDTYLVFSWTLPMVLAILVNNVFETNFVLMGANFFQAFFWFVAGACVLSMREGVKE